ncbi:hypothetical protein KAI58_03155 [Candidatus Gracilibacteria bacterium]|nr:hypothetical protein [Candidatus Gracilibacteria bacterium]
MDKNFKLAVVGNESSVLLFRSLGCETHSVFSKEEAQTIVEELFQAHKGDEVKTPIYAVVFVEECFYKNFSNDVTEKFSKRAMPAIIPVPSSSSKDKKFASNRLRKIVERAVGSDILG